MKRFQKGIRLKKKKERKLDKYQGDRILSPSKNDLKQKIYKLQQS